MRRIRAGLQHVGRSWSMDLASDDATTVLISSGRSGSTWLAGMLQVVPGSRTIFEPFHPKHGMAPLIPHRYTYYRPDQPMAALADALRRVVTGHLRSRWTTQLDAPLRLVVRRRLLKLVRANLLFPWMHTRFPAFRYVLLIRHPVPVIMSQLSRGWLLSSRRVRAQAEALAYLGNPDLARFGWPEAGFESNLIFWAVENAVALRHAADSGALIVHYENLCTSPEAELHRIADYLGVTLPASVWPKVHQPSRSSSRDVGSMSIPDKVHRWRKDVTDRQTEFTGAVLRECGLADLYGDDGLPRESG